MAKVEFSRAYDHTWPSRSVTAYPAGWLGTVKAEVAEAAGAAGALVGVKASPVETPVPDALPPADDPNAIVVEAAGADGPVPTTNAAVDETPVS